MAVVKLEYKGSVTPKATSFLTPQKFDMGCEADYNAPESDIAIIKTLQKEFQSAMAEGVKKQASELDKWLTEKNALIAELVNGVDALKSSFPSDPGKASAFGQKTDALKKAAAEVKSLEADYQKIVSDWAENCRRQQAQVAMVVAVKKARLKTYAAKDFRVKAGLAIKAALVVAAIVLGVAAMVMSAGSLTPIVLGLAAAGLALSGISSMGALGKSIVNNVNTEKKLLANLKQDVEAVKAAMVGVADRGSKIAKHVIELQNLIRIKEDQIRAIDNDTQKYLVDSNNYKAELKRLEGQGASLLLDPKKLAAKYKASGDIDTKLQKLASKVAALRADIFESQKLLENVRALGVDLAKVSAQAPSTVLGNLKDRFTSVDCWLDAAGTVGGLVGGAAYVI